MGHDHDSAARWLKLWAHLEPRALALVVAPGLALELLGGQELLVGARLVVEGEEERLGVQLGVGGGVVQRLVLDGGEAGGDAAGELAHARRHVLPLPVLRRRRRPPARAPLSLPRATSRVSSCARASTKCQGKAECHDP